ncbi:nascent polypeptide-associated complex subunit alpha, muscle-specific form-like [Bos taurus]|uniref:nascent polypeptide-associated complex subunit alpha, muscle-specific form-like n=1 Tax=Bos taurus TaxID=9913 RepID=UPI0028CB6865|nr:nascent polypeptide-associated complex subunit alpha, muscle-specific form-like [Bos taurus]
MTLRESQAGTRGAVRPQIEDPKLGTGAWRDTGGGGHTRAAGQVPGRPGLHLPHLPRSLGFGGGSATPPVASLSSRSPMTPRLSPSAPSSPSTLSPRQPIPLSPPAAHPPQPPGGLSILSSPVACPPSAPRQPVHPQPSGGPSILSAPAAHPPQPPAARPPSAPWHPFWLQGAGAHPSPGPSGPAHYPPQYTEPRGSHAHLRPGSPGCPQPASCPLCLGRDGLVLRLQPPDPELPEGSPRAEESRAPGKLRVPISVADPVAPPDAAKHGPALPAGASGVTLTPICDPGCIRGQAPHLESGGTEPAPTALCILVVQHILSACLDGGSLTPRHHAPSRILRAFRPCWQPRGAQVHTPSNPRPPTPHQHPT